MVGFCSGANSSNLVVSLNNYTSLYTATMSSSISCLPGTTIATLGWPSYTGSNPVPLGVTTSTGDTTLMGRINTLFTKYSISALSSSSTTNDISTYKTNIAILHTAINQEYCYYYKCYQFALKEYLTALATEGASMPADLLANCQHLNRILSQITQLSTALGTKCQTDAAALLTPAELATFTSNLQTIDEKIKGELANINDSDVDIKAAMIDYTLEKNASSRNMMGIYGFLNIVAVGMLVYLYRSSK